MTQKQLDQAAKLGWKICDTPAEFGRKWWHKDLGDGLWLNDEDLLYILNTVNCKKFIFWFTVVMSLPAAFSVLTMFYLLFSV